MTRDDLEAVIWQNMPVTPRSPVSAARVKAILQAADAYAAGDSPGLTALRRAVLHCERADIGGDTRKEAGRGQP